MLIDQIKSDLVTAMKAGEALRTQVLRMILSEINYKKIDLGHELTQDDVIVVLQKEAKKRREAIESYTTGGRTDQAQSEKEELAIISVYLPALLSEAELRAEIAKMDLSGDFGSAMRVVSPVFKGRADGALVAKVVKEVLSADH